MAELYIAEEEKQSLTNLQKKDLSNVDFLKQ